jgi:Fe-S-cluster containining protein
MATFMNVAEVHRRIDARVAPLVAHHGGRLHCRKGCSGCCTDDLTVFEVEADEIRRNYTDLLRSGEAHTPGACAFLSSEGLCRIYEHRPYVCRTQGLPLRWLEEDEAEDIVEYRDICGMSQDTLDPIALSEDECWLIGPFEEVLNDLQDLADGGAMRRVSLRSLFASH